MSWYPSSCHWPQGSNSWILVIWQNIGPLLVWYLLHNNLDDNFRSFTQKKKKCWWKVDSCPNNSVNSLAFWHVVAYAKFCALLVVANFKFETTLIPFWACVDSIQYRPVHTIIPDAYHSDETGDINMANIDKYIPLFEIHIMHTNTNKYLPIAAQMKSSTFQGILVQATQINTCPGQYIHNYNICWYLWIHTSDDTTMHRTHQTVLAMDQYPQYTSWCLQNMWSYANMLRTLRSNMSKGANWQQFLKRH